MKEDEIREEKRREEKRGEERRREEKRREEQLDKEIERDPKRSKRDNVMSLQNHRDKLSSPTQEFFHCSYEKSYEE